MPGCHDVPSAYATLQLAKAAAQESSEEICAAVAERLPYLVQFAAEQGDERLLEIMEQAKIATDAQNLELMANALLE